jgi:hypothetical protein
MHPRARIVATDVAPFVDHGGSLRHEVPSADRVRAFLTALTVVLMRR